MPRKIPTHLTEDEHVEALINRARKLINVNPDVFEADWLVSGGIGSPEWVVIDNYDDGTTITVRFDDYLPNGSMLTDRENSLLLHPIQKAAFHLKMGNLQHPSGWHKQWLRVIDTSVNLARWVILNEEVFQPQEYGFQLVSDDHLRGYFQEFASGGIANTLKLEDRLLTILHYYTESDLELSDILKNKNCLDEKFLEDAVRWLNTQDAYLLAKRLKMRVVSRKWLEAVLGCSSQLFDRYPAVANVLNQLDLKHSYSAPDEVILVPRDERRIMPVTPLVRRTMYTHKKELRIFASAHNLVNEIPKLSEAAFNDQHLDKLGLDGHTKLLPMEVGLGAINNAAEMIICYGEQIVDAAAAFAERYTDSRAENTQAKCNHQMKLFFNERKSDWAPNPEYGNTTLMERYNVISFTSDSRTLDINQGITFKTLHLAFYGACALLIGMCKPVREGELHRLKLDCLGWEFEGGGAELIHRQGKSGVLDQRYIIRRPIPSLVARAIQLLQVLSAKLRKIYDDENGVISDHLFYIPHRGISSPTGKVLGETLNSAIDTFCLLLNLPRDLDGQRWKIRVHEMRKFFLLVMYKHHDGELRRTLGYAAGHLDEEHIDAYTSFSHDDPESVKYESQCISDMLISLECGNRPTQGHDGLHALYNHVREYFNVQTIRSLGHESFIKFLSMLQRSGAYHSTVYTVEISGPDGVLTTLDFAIKFEEHRDDKYD
ncbi:hypothetical protein NPS29_00255 [Pseudomonas putida]|uniref:hypothetical protein n=1 Tax=Pseudomonas putida TaxID=303 RepID=UPI0023635E36|nr:hypothetical protein [Pseudomonas putida]MDD1963742.1 hypothetical protein [Pseudomonas putida]